MENRQKIAEILKEADSYQIKEEVIALAKLKKENASRVLTLIDNDPPMFYEQAFKEILQRHELDVDSTHNITVSTNTFNHPDYDVLVTDAEIEEYCQSLARYITSEYLKDPATPVTALCVLNGGFMFFANVIKYLPFDIDVKFVKIKTYVGTEKSSDYEMNFLETIAPDNNILIFDDILDSGHTAELLATRLSQTVPFKSIKLYTLAARSKGYDSVIARLREIGYVDFAHRILTDEWLVGYGMDNVDGFMRQVPYILKKI